MGGGGPDWKLHRAPTAANRSFVRPFISSAFVLTDTMPGPVRAFAEHQPVTSLVNTIRDLLTQQPVSTDIWIALASCLGTLIVVYALAMATYHRKISQ